MLDLVTVALMGMIGSAAAKKCYNLTVTVPVMARQGQFNVPTITTNEDVTTFFQNFTSIAGGTNYTAQALLGYINVKDSASISAKFCTPDHGLGSKPVVQVLSHGIGFDKTYWDLPYNNYSYSYIDVAVDKYGYSTLSYDRYGIGNSSKGDPYTMIQAPAEVSVLYGLNTMLREGKFPNVSHAFTTGSIVNVGHSFGSQQSYMLSLMYPNVTDALILTGFSLNGSFLVPTLASFNAKIARQNQPFRFGSSNAVAAVNAISTAAAQDNITLIEVAEFLNLFNITTAEAADILQTTEIWDIIAGTTSTPYPIPQNLSTGYLTWSDGSANQYNFLYPTGFDPMIAPYAEAHKQPFTVGEVFSLGGAPSISHFTGPVQVVTGQEDSIYCGGDCLNTAGIVPAVANIPAGVGAYFPSAKTFKTYIPPATGHAINVHYSAVSAYNEIQAFLQNNGFTPVA